MRLRISSHLAFILMALLVTLLWTTSWMIIKADLAGLSPVFLAGLRYSAAAVVLFPFAARSGAFRQIRSVTRRGLTGLVSVGILFYGITQGGLFFSLSVMPATQLSLILSASTVLVAFGSMILLKEQPRLLQWVGTAVYLGGAVMFLAPFHGLGGLPALAAGAITLTANAAGTLLTRTVNRDRVLSPLGVTTVASAIGGVLLLIAGAATERVPHLSLEQWGWLIWLAVANTALAFTLWNRAAGVLSALETSVINNSMLFQVAILAWVILGENLNGRRIAAVVFATLGVILVQLPQGAPARLLARLRPRVPGAPER